MTLLQRIFSFVLLTITIGLAGTPVRKKIKICLSLVVTSSVVNRFLGNGGKANQHALSTVWNNIRWVNESFYNEDTSTDTSNVFQSFWSPLSTP